MKEATGELNMTVFVVVAVGVMSAFFYTVVWPNIRGGQESVANCNNAICDRTPVNGRVRCDVWNKEGTRIVARDISCPYKG